MTAPAELSARALGWGLALGFVLAAANVYAGLKIAYVDAGATTIVLLSFAAFGLGARRFTAREVNVAQVAGASASTMAVTCGLIGPIPALAMTGHEVAPVTILLWGAALATLGTVVALAFRASLIEVKRLAFPSAWATGELIRNLFVEGRGSRAHTRLLAAAAAVAIAITVARDGLHLIAPAWLLPISIAGVPAAQLSIGLAASPLVVGVGVLAGARVGLSMLAGAVVAWLVIPPYLELAEPSFGSVISWTLWPGAALMIASSITMLAFDARSLVRAVRRESIAAGPRVVVALVGSAIALVVLGWVGFDVPPIFAALGVILAAVFSIAAMQATGETDTTPAGPLGGIGQIATGSLGAATVADPLYVGGTVNGVAAHSAAMMNAWKAGSAVAATPSRLVVAQLAGIVVGAVGAIVAYAIIREAYGLGDTAMPAPGAISWRVTAATVVGGLDNLPAGAPLAALVAGIAGIVLAVLQRTQRLSRMLPTPIAMGIGFVLPVSVTATLALAAILHAILTMRWRRWSEGPASTVGSGLIVGEAFAGILIATIIVLGDI